MAPAGPLIRAVVNILMMGGTAVGKAFARAYQQAKLQPPPSAGAGSASSSSAAAQKQAFQRAMRRKMDPEEARMVLNLPPSYNRKILNERFEKIFELNDAKKGGSFYLQSKVYRAKESLEEELPPEEKTEDDESEGEEGKEGAKESDSESGSASGDESSSADSPPNDESKSEQSASSSSSSEQEKR